MAVLAVPYDSVLQLRLVIGNDPESGKAIIRNKSFNRVKDAANAEDVFEVANSLAGLQKYSLDEIRLNSSEQLISE